MRAIRLAIPILLLLATSCAAPVDSTGTHARLESWVVLGKGRHLRLVVTDPRTGDEQIIEFTSTLLRSDYVSPADETRRNRLARMSPGDVLQPMLASPDLRVEGEYQITMEQFREIARDRLYRATYFLLGPNSNSAMVDCLIDAGLDVPAHVLVGGGALGEFPGVAIEAGEEIPPHRWVLFGIPRESSEN
ncbi:MAG: hypothetical protein ACYTF7_00670 [Planctomycetota bacterium]|jgi:hypothetical protein